LTPFWDKVDIVYVMHFSRSDVTLLFEQWIIFKNLQFIRLFLNIWTLTFYCFRLKNAFYLFVCFRVSNHCWAFQSLFWLSKLPSNHSATVTTLLFAIISIFQGRIQGRKIVIFHTKYPKKFRASLRSAQFF
jgi:hypothetical protein